VNVYGKTILGNQFCFHHVGRAGGRCVYLSLLVESHAKMLRHLAPMRFFKPEQIPERVYYVSGYPALRQGGPDALPALIRETLKERRATLFVVDGMESLRGFARGEQHIKEFVHEMQAFTAMVGCTSLLMSFKDPSYSWSAPAPSAS
jgi:circadian clock protein KaiC